LPYTLFSTKRVWRSQNRPPHPTISTYSGPFSLDHGFAHLDTGPDQPTTPEVNMPTYVRQLTLEGLRYALCSTIPNAPLDKPRRLPMTTTLSRTCHSSRKFGFLRNIPNLTQPDQHCWRLQEWILKVGLQSHKTINKRRSEHASTGVNSKSAWRATRLQSSCTGVHSRTRHRSAMAVTVYYADHRSDGN
jgi:hypothetical protein